MSVDLMQKRYLISADYPGNEFPTGTILYKNKKINSGDWASIENNNLIGLKISGINQYPHLFRELHWFEFRDGKDMPEYVKCDDIEGVYKIQSWSMDNKFPVGNIDSRTIITMCDNVFPATETEFNEYKQSKIK